MATEADASTNPGGMLTKVDDEVYLGEEKLDSQEFDLMLFGVGGQLNFFRTFPQ